MRASIRRGGSSESSGLLLGRSRKNRGVRIAVIDDFEPLPVTPKRGRLQPPEGTRLKVMGAYRAATGGAFRLDEWDAAVISGAFNDPAMVYLLMRPETGHAAFFIQENGVVHGYASYLVFPFDAGLLGELGPLQHAGPPVSRRRWAAAAVVAAAGVSAGGWYLRPVAPPPMPNAPAAPLPAKTQLSSPRENPRRGVTRSSKKTPMLVEASTATSSSLPARRPNPFRRLIRRLSAFSK